MPPEDLATQGVRASAATSLILLSQNIPASASGGLKYNFQISTASFVLNVDGDMNLPAIMSWIWIFDKSDAADGLAPHELDIR